MLCGLAQSPLRIRRAKCLILRRTRSRGSPAHKHKILGRLQAGSEIRIRGKPPQFTIVLLRLANQWSNLRTYRQLYVPPLSKGQIMTGVLFSEPMRVETVRTNGIGLWGVGLSGVQTEKFRRVNLTAG